MSSPLLLELENVDVNLGGRRVLKNITWQFRSGEKWLVTGANGSGKSVFLRLLAGKLWPSPYSRLPGSRRYFLGPDTTESPVGLESQLVWISPEQQRRYRQSDWLLTGEEVVLTGFRREDLLYQPPTADEISQVQALLQELNLSPLGDRLFKKMSQGELRKILIARACIACPRVLLLDELYDGLDNESRAGISQILENLIPRFSLQAVITAHRWEDSPSWVTHALKFENGKVSHQGKVSAPDIVEKTFLSPTETRAVPRNKTKSCITSRSALAGSETPEILRLKNCYVYRGNIPVLSDINWVVHAGENWIVRGNNGSGKSTLIRFLYGDLSCAHGGMIERFSSSKLPETVVDARKGIGLVSSRFQAAMPPEQSVLEIVLSGFDVSTGLWGAVFSDRIKPALDVLETVKMKNYAERKFGMLSYGEQRRVLLARATVHSPRLLLLDEPMDGLDVETRQRMKTSLDLFVENGGQFIFVTHHPDDVPDTASRQLFLEAGRIIEAE